MFEVSELQKGTTPQFKKVEKFEHWSNWSFRTLYQAWKGKLHYVLNIFG